MKTVSVGNRSKYLSGYDCLQCPKDIKSGDTLLLIEVPGVAFHAREQVVHLECIQKVLGKMAPPAPAKPSPKQQFRVLREAMIASGEFFVDA